ncbi:hypothetical protein SUDANB1_01944 [Streptomyces sp. enrichment culture]|uniref:hypothetical protein n=1 Tax=Streptomyces sp. enrichment culture TaxID=1795815 RepID=UPI003F556827
MEPISLAVLAAVASGAGGQVGKSLWDQLTSLVRRPTREQSAGAAELESLQVRPTDRERAEQLRTVLEERANQDPEFRRALEAWASGAAQHADTLFGDVRNEMSGGTVNGYLLQGKTFSHLSLGYAPPSPQPAPAPEEAD